jgi:hypothetical protein
MVNMKNEKQYVVLEHLGGSDMGLKFFTTNTENNTRSSEGELWYKEVMFTDSIEEAQEACGNGGLIKHLFGINIAQL